MYLFFDTETTGLPKNYKAPVTDIHNWPRLVQLAWQMYTINGDIVDSTDFIIKPEGFTISKEASSVHGISTERAINEGVELLTVLKQFNEKIEQATQLVAHNMNFDEKIIGAEFIRNKISTKLFNKERVCTMLGSVDYCQISGYYGYKWPKLSELHIKLFGKDFEEAHNAAADIEATAKCFWKLKELGIL